MASLVTVERKTVSISEEAANTEVLRQESVGAAGEAGRRPASWEPRRESRRLRRCRQRGGRGSGHVTMSRTLNSLPNVTTLWRVLSEGGP